MPYSVWFNSFERISGNKCYVYMAGKYNSSMLLYKSCIYRTCPFKSSYSYKSSDTRKWCFLQAWNAYHFTTRIANFLLIQGKALTMFCFRHKSTHLWSLNPQYTRFLRLHTGSNECCWDADHQESLFKLLFFFLHLSCSFEGARLCLRCLGLILFLGKYSMALTYWPKTDLIPFRRLFPCLGKDLHDKVESFRLFSEMFHYYCLNPL